jgi:hypothetical protein
MESGSIRSVVLMCVLGSQKVILIPSTTVINAKDNKGLRVKKNLSAHHCVPSLKLVLTCFALVTDGQRRVLW